MAKNSLTTATVFATLTRNSDGQFFLVLTTLPNVLTLGRIVMIPIIVICFYMNTRTGHWIAAIAFIAACLTDYLDGYFARAWAQTTRIGQFLDPVADKLLVASVLLLLAGFGRISPITMLPAIVILCREIMVSGLRECLSEIHVSVPVTKLSKWKTAAQMGSLSLLLLGETTILGAPAFFLGEILLWIAAVLTLHSGLSYLRMGYKHLGTST